MAADAREFMRGGLKGSVQPMQEAVVGESKTGLWLLMAAAGAAGGVLLAAAGLSLFRRYSPVDLPRMGEIHLNVTVLCFSGLLALASSMIFGVLPALRLMASDPQAALQQNSTRSPGSRQSHRLRTWLIGLQVCGCTALLLITGLFAKGLLYLLHQNKGFATSHVAVAEVRLAPQAYGKSQSRTNRADRPRIFRSNGAEIDCGAVLRGARP